MITVYRFGKKTKKKIGEYEGTANNMADIAKAMEEARKACPKGKLIIEGATLPERRKKKPEIE